MFYVNLGPFYADFKGFQKEICLNTWQYKLDPYICEENYWQRPCLTVVSKLNLQDTFEKRIFEGKPVHKINFGIYTEYIQKKENGILYLYVTRRDTGRVYLVYKISENWSKVELLFSREDSSGHLAFEYLSIMVFIFGLKHSILTFHGVLMEHQNQGIIISAPSGTGKTTHARLWRDLKRALIINGDKSTCKKVDGVWTGYGLPWSGTSGEQINRNVPIKALVVLERGDYNEAQRIGGLEAFGAVLPHVQCPTWDKELADKAMELLDNFLNDIPIIRLRCRPDAESVEVLSKLLEEL